MSLVDKVVRRLGGRLATDELVVHAVPAFHLGGAREIVSAGFRSSGWSVAAAVAGAIDGNHPSTQPVSVLPMPQRCIIALTDQRLLVFSNGLLVNSPVSLVHNVAFGDVAWVGEPAPDGRVAKSERVIVGLAGGSLLGWEFPRMAITAGRALITDLTQHVSDSPDDSLPRAPSPRGMGKGPGAGPSSNGTSLPPSNNGTSPPISN
jgi:hypothetical protein